MYLFNFLGFSKYNQHLIILMYFLLPKHPQSCPLAASILYKIIYIYIHFFLDFKYIRINIKFLKSFQGIIASAGYEENKALSTSPLSHMTQKLLFSTLSLSLSSFINFLNKILFLRFLFTFSNRK